MIDGFIMRDPGSYEDIIDILVDERVIPKDTKLPIRDRQPASEAGPGVYEDQPFRD